MTTKTSRVAPTWRGSGCWRASSPPRTTDGTAGGFAEELATRFTTERDGRGVQLLTYHRAKGLEFDAVFLPRLIDGELPFRSGRSKADPVEERRLLYVGITRARRYLFLTWSRDAKTRPSPYLARDGPASAPARRSRWRRRCRRRR